MVYLRCFCVAILWFRGVIFLAGSNRLSAELLIPLDSCQLVYERAAAGTRVSCPVHLPDHDWDMGFSSLKCRRKFIDCRYTGSKGSKSTSHKGTSLNSFVIIFRLLKYLDNCVQGVFLIKIGNYNYFCKNSIINWSSIWSSNIFSMKSSSKKDNYTFDWQPLRSPYDESNKKSVTYHRATWLHPDISPS